MSDKIRIAVVVNQPAERVQSYMPSNYEAVQNGADVLVYGVDNKGWSLDGYVLPRLASGLIYGHEVTAA